MSDVARIRVMLIDDHASFRQPLVFMLGWEEDMEVVAQVGSLSEALAVIENDEPGVDVAIVDLDLPDGSGTEFVKALRRYRPRATALVLSALSEQTPLALAVEAGAAAVMHKATRMEDLLEAIRQLHGGEQLLSQREVIEALRLVARERESESEARQAVARLTPRERDVLQALAEGLSDKEISQRLHVEPGTVHSHVTSIFSKLEVTSRLQALVFAVRHGVVTIE